MNSNTIQSIFKNSDHNRLGLAKCVINEMSDLFYATGRTCQNRITQPVPEINTLSPPYFQALAWPIHPPGTPFCCFMQSRI